MSLVQASCDFKRRVMTWNSPAPKKLIWSNEASLERGFDPAPKKLFGVRSLFGAIKLLWSGVSTPYTLSRVICTISSELKCNSVLYLFE